MNEHQCSGCRFWRNVWPEADANDDSEGTCQRYPAIHVGSPGEDPRLCVQDASYWAQPVMYATDWCGEFRLKS